MKLTDQRTAIFLITTVSVLGIGGLRILTGPQLAFSLLYFIPILLACWYVGDKAGYFLAFLSSVAWLLVDIALLHRLSNKLIPVINELFRLIVFLAGVFLLAKLKMALQQEKHLAMTDPLTGALNRRAFEMYATLELERFHRHRIPFSVLFFDIDNFKTINDTRGHHAGDDLLRSVAQVIISNIRSIDIFSRIGGDEFILILSGAKRDLAQAGTQKIRTVLQNEMTAKKWPVTFSIGTVIFSSPPRDLNELFKAADEAMYAAKTMGKNREVFKEFCYSN